MLSFTATHRFKSLRVRNMRRLKAFDYGAVGVSSRLERVSESEERNKAAKALFTQLPAMPLNLSEAAGI